MGTQTAIATQIYNAKADYVLALKTIPHFMDKLKIGLSKQSLKDLKVSTSAMTSGKGHHRTESVKFGVFQFLNYLYIINDWVGLMCCHGGAATKPMEQNYP